MVYATFHNDTPLYAIGIIIMPMENTEETTEKKTRHGLISNDNIRISLVIPKKLKATLEKKAAAEQRSMSNYIVRILSAAMEPGSQDDKQNNQ